MGWSFPWVSPLGSDFNFEFGVSFRDGEEGTYNYAPKRAGAAELPGISVFAKDGAGAVFHTYSTYGRGLDLMNGAYNYLDLTPKGRDEEEFDFPMAWVRLRDRYDDTADQQPGR